MKFILNYGGKSYQIKVSLQKKKNIESYYRHNQFCSQRQ